MGIAAARVAKGVWAPSAPAAATSVARKPGGVAPSKARALLVVKCCNTANGDATSGPSEPSEPAGVPRPSAASSPWDGSGAAIQTAMAAAVRTRSAGDGDGGCSASNGCQTGVVDDGASGRPSRYRSQSPPRGGGRKAAGAGLPFGLTAMAAASRARALVADKRWSTAKGEAVGVMRWGNMWCSDDRLAAVAAARTRSAAVGKGNKERGAWGVWTLSRCASSSQEKRNDSPQSSQSCSL
jgi:hypothetical protein